MPAWANALDANRPKPFDVPVTTIILRIQISDPLFFSLFGIAHRMAANLIERSNRLRIGAPDLPVDPVSGASRRRTEG